MSPTVELIITGLLQGLPLALLVGIYHLLSERHRKQGQRNYLRNIINDNIQNILTAEEIKPPFQGPPIPGDHIRRTIYDNMHRRVDSFLSHSRASDKISYEEEVKIRNPFNTIDFFIKERERGLGEGHITLVTVEMCQKVLVKELKEVEWLEL